jgi:hypothetical protein
LEHPPAICCHHGSMAARSGFGNEIVVAWRLRLISKLRPLV